MSKKESHWNPPETVPANSVVLGMITIKDSGLKFITAVHIKDGGVLGWFDSQTPVDTEHYEFAGWMHLMDAFMLLGGEP